MKDFHGIKMGCLFAITLIKHFEVVILFILLLCLIAGLPPFYFNPILNENIHRILPYHLQALKQLLLAFL